jgi:hypothetical protein
LVSLKHIISHFAQLRARGPRIEKKRTEKFIGEEEAKIERVRWQMNS